MKPKLRIIMHMEIKCPPTLVSKKYEPLRSIPLLPSVLTNQYLDAGAWGYCVISVIDLEHVANTVNVD